MNNNKPIPPQVAERLLLWFLRDDLAEEVAGDLEESFRKNVAQRSVLWAKIIYWYQVLNYLRPFAIKNYRSNNSKHFIMYQHNFKISLRSLLKNKDYSLLNLGGLAIGMTVAILISLWVHDEWSFNKHHKYYNDIARVMVNYEFSGEDVKTGNTLPPASGPFLKESYGTQFDQVVMVRNHPEERIFTTKRGDFLEKGYFMQHGGPEMFSLNMLHGGKGGLREMNSVLLSQSLAQKLFGEADPLNKVVKMDGTDLTVTGVYEDIPHNSIFNDASYFAPLSLYMNGWSDLTVWNNYFINTFVKLRDGTNFQHASSLVKDVLLPHTEGPNKKYLFLHPMSKWHLHSEFENGVPATSERLKFVWLFGLIAVFVLALASINFMNLSTAHSEKRAKEIGVRKTIGSARYQLVSQLLTESIIISISGFVIASGITALILPWFNEMAGKEMSIPFGSGWFWLAGVGISLLTGILAGSYPAFYLSSFSPIKSLKGSFKSARSTALGRKVLVVFQFTISIVLIIGTFVVYQQVQHVKDRPTGYSRNNLIMFPKRTSEIYGKYDVLRNELKKTGAVTAVGEANYPLTNTLGNNDGFNWEGKDPTYDPVFNTISVSYDYGEAIDWEIVEGRDFTRDIPSDVSKAIIITESAKELMGLQEVVGAQITSNNSEGPGYTVIGVVKDMIKGNPFQAPRPAFMFLSESSLSFMFIRLNPEVSTAEALARIEKVIKEIVPSTPFDYKFMDEEYNAKFKAEERIGKLISFFAILAIFISCLGLFGLASFVTEKRTKEIGIRKVMGASVVRLWQMLSKDFVILVIISILIASPISYYLLENWLDQYDYKIDISWWIFALAGFSALIITIVTVSYRTIAAALINPVENLRSE